MANKSLFNSLVGRMLPQADTRNEAGGAAYAFSPEHALAQYAATGCTNSTFYASAQDQVQTVLSLAQQVDPAFVARVAVYARERGAMKDMPALLCAVLATRDGELLERVFPRVIDQLETTLDELGIPDADITARMMMVHAPGVFKTEFTVVNKVGGSGLKNGLSSSNILATCRLTVP